MKMTNTTICKLTTTIAVRTGVIILGLGLVLLLNGCADIVRQSRTSLVMIKEEEIKAESYLADLEKQLQILDKNQEKKIASECGITLLGEEFSKVEAGPQLLQVSGSGIIDMGASWFLDEIYKELQEQLKRYSAVYKAKIVTTNFYKSIGNPKTHKSKPKLQSNCFRFSRFSGENIIEKPLVDLIVQMRITKKHDALRIRPLRLYQSEALAESDDKSYGIAASINMNAVWLQENRGMSEEVFNRIFLKEKIMLSNSKPVLKYFFNKKWEDYPVLPLPPWSRNVDSSAPDGNVEIIISMAESGKPNKLLKFFAERFKSGRKDIAELLKDAAEARILR